MALQTRLVDDLDGSTDGIRTYRFGLEGTGYDIDLSDTNLGRLRDALAPFITAARPATPQPAAKTAKSKTGRASAAPRPADIRAWWAANTGRLTEPRTARGRIPEGVMAAYLAAHPATTRP